MNRYDLCQEIVWNIDRLSETITAYQKHSHSYGGNAPLFMQQVHTLALIGREPGINLNTLTSKTGRSKVTVSQQVSRLVKLGYVTKLRREDNQREVSLTLTPAGTAVFNYHEADDQRFYRRLIDELGVFSKQDLALISRFISTMLLAFQKDEEEGYN